MIIYHNKTNIKKYHKSTPKKPFGLPVYLDCDYILEKKELYNLLLNRYNYTFFSGYVILNNTSNLYNFIDYISNENRLVWSKLIYLHFNKLSHTERLGHIINLVKFINNQISYPYHKKPVKHLLLIVYDIINKDIKIKIIFEERFNKHGHFNLFYKDLNKIKSFDNNQHMFLQRDGESFSFKNSDCKFKW